MTKKLQIYKCEICGNVVEILHEGVGELVCCKKPMKTMEENAVDASQEKHVPVIERTSNGIKIKVGSAPHPMEQEHYIEWVQLITNGKSYRQFLKPGGIPEALLEINVSVSVIKAREYCNVHGLWKSNAKLLSSDISPVRLGDFATSSKKLLTRSLLK